MPGAAACDAEERNLSNRFLREVECCSLCSLPTKKSHGSTSFCYDLSLSTSTALEALNLKELFRLVLHDQGKSGFTNRQHSTTVRLFRRLGIAHITVMCATLQKMVFYQAKVCIFWVASLSKAKFRIFNIKTCALLQLSIHLTDFDASIPKLLKKKQYRNCR